MNVFEQLRQTIVRLLAINQFLRKRNHEMAITFNQYLQANALLQAAAAKAEATIASQATEITTLQSQSTDFTAEATNTLIAANQLDPTISTDPTQLPDVDPTAPVVAAAAPVAST